MAGIGMNERPIVCGGYEFSSLCYTFDNNNNNTSWQPSFDLLNDVAYGSFSPSPFDNSSQYLVMSGGRSKSLNYSNLVDVLTDKGWERLQHNLPTELAFHCMILLNSTSLITVGGESWGQLSLSGTFILNSKSQSWVTGPALNSARSRHSCSRIRTSMKTPPDFAVIAAGGWSSSEFMASVEILDDGEDSWKFGPELPKRIYGSAMVEDPFGGVILIGGWSSFEEPEKDTLYRLAHSGKGARWMKLPQKLDLARRYPFAFTVPENVLNCTLH
jgi:hypothetical protein